MEAPTTPSACPTNGDEAPVHSKGLARKLKCSVLSIVAVGTCVILLIQVVLTLTAVPDWGAETKEVMIELEQQNLMKLASDKAEFVTEIFGRVEEGLLQNQAFAGQVLLDVPETMVVDDYLGTYSGLEQTHSSWKHSVW